jgi:hypothetical protein
MVKHSTRKRHRSINHSTRKNHNNINSSNNNINSSNNNINNSNNNNNINSSTKFSAENILAIMLRERVQSLEKNENEKYRKTALKLFPYNTHTSIKTKRPNSINFVLPSNIGPIHYRLIGNTVYVKNRKGRYIVLTKLVS